MKSGVFFLVFSVAAGVLCFATQTFAALEVSYRYDTFACRYFNFILTPLGKCVVENYELIETGHNVETVSNEERSAVDVQTVVVREVATSTIIIEREPQITYVQSVIDNATLAQIVADMIVSNQLTTTAYVDNNIESLQASLTKLSTLFSKQLDSDSDRISDVQDNISDEIDELQSGEESFTTLAVTGSATVEGQLTLSGTSANIALGSNYLSGDGDDEGVFVDANGNVGIGTSTPGERLVVSGDVYVTGAFYDSSHVAGTNGYVLQTTGSGTQWVATSSLGISGGGGGGLVSSDIDTSAELLAILTNETGTGNVVFSDAPTFTGTISGGAASLSSTLTVTGTTTLATTTIASSTIGRITMAGDSITDFTGTGLTVTAGALTVSTSSLANLNADSLDNEDGAYYLNRTNHTGTQLAATISDFSSTARGLFSSSATGLTYTSGTGAFSLTAGYNIPLTASTTQWNSFYTTPSTSITAGNHIDWTGNTLDVVTTGDWTGTFDGQEGSYYLDAGNLTGTLASGRLTGAYTGITGFGTLTGLTVSGTTTLATTTVASSSIGTLNVSNQITAPLIQIDTNSTGVSLDTDGDGMLIIAGTGPGADEDLRFNFDDVNNYIQVTSNTNVTTLDFSGIALSTNASRGYEIDDIRYFTASSTIGSVMIGELAGSSAAGAFNILMGSSAGINSSGSYNISLGYDAGNVNTGSNNNLFGEGVGYYNTGNHNNFFGAYAGFYNTGSYNQFIGYDAGYNLKATDTVAIGREALSGSGETLNASFVANNNTAVGSYAGYSATTSANNNVLLGYRAGYNLGSGANNIVVGYDLNLIATSTSNSLNIGNLIFGTGIDGTGYSLSSGNIGIGTTTPIAKFQVLDTTEQLRSGYDASNYFTVTTGATGTTTFAVVGTSPTFQFTDTQLELVDDGDITKRMSFNLSGITTGTKSTWSFPAGTGTFVGTSLTQTLTNKTLTSPVISAGSISGILTTTGTLTFGDNGDNVVFDSNTWDINGAGVGSGFTGFTTTGTLDAATFTASGATSLLSTLSVAGTSTLATSTMSALTVSGTTTSVFARIMGTSTTAFGVYEGDSDPVLIVDTQTNSDRGHRMTLQRNQINITTSGVDFKIGNETSGGLNAYLDVSNNRDILFRHAATTYMVMSGNASTIGNFGIGSSTPFHKLTVGGNGYFGGNLTATGTLTMLGTSTFATYVGIGTSTPTQTLHVQGGVRVSGAFFDSDNASGTTNMVLRSTGTGTQWVVPGLDSFSGVILTTDTLAIQSNSVTSGGYDRNVVLGFGSMTVSGNRDDNVIIGYNAYSSSTSGGTNVGDGNVIIGSLAAMTATDASNNIIIGYNNASTLRTGLNNILIGHNIDVATSTQSNTLNIGNLIYGTGVDGTGTTLSSGNIGIGSTSPIAKLSIIPGAASAITYAGNSYIPGVWTQTTSGRSAYTATVNNDFLDSSGNNGHFVSIFPFDDSTSSDDESWKAFRLQTGSTPTDKFWVNKYGEGYFASNVGIGTSSPLSRLHIVSEEIGTGVNKGFRIDNYNSTQSYSIRTGVTSVQNTSLSIYDETAAANRMVILSSGNVGVGTANPQTLSHIYKAATTGTTPVGLLSLQLSDDGADTNGGEGPAIDFYISDSTGTSGTGNSHLAGQIATVRTSATDAVGGGDLIFSTADNAASLIEAMRINYLGNVGIGTTTIGARLALQATSTTDILNLFETGGTEVLTVLESGNVGIGTTTPEHTLDVSSSSNFPARISGTNTNLTALTIINLVSNNNWQLAVAGTTNSFGFSSGDFYFRNSTQDINPLVITTSGQIGIGTTTPTEELTVSGTIQATNLLGGATTLSTDANGNIIRTPSDARLKTDVEEIENALDTVLALRGVSYEWLDKERFGDMREIGFLAQEVDVLIPEVVRKGGEYWTLNTPNMLAVVVEAIKEMWATVMFIEEDVTDLKQENEALRARVEALENNNGDSSGSETEEDEDEGDDVVEVELPEEPVEDTQENEVDISEEIPPSEEESGEDVQGEIIPPV